MKLILGSTSPFRSELLEKLGVPFSTSAPMVDEAVLPGEAPEQLVRRLAVAKAEAVGVQNPGSLIIGSDQVACLGDTVLGKPGNRERAIEQLAASSGKCVTFLTGLCLLNTVSGNKHVLCEPFKVHFRLLDRASIERYVDAEQPFGCAGSFKSEGLGISLFQRLEGDDPNALIGLPLIRLITMLGEEGVFIP